MIKSDDVILVGEKEDLGFLFDLPWGVLYVKDYKLFFFDECWVFIREDMELKDLLDEIRSNRMLMAKIDGLKDSVINPYNSIKRVFECNKRLLEKYGIIGVRLDKSGVASNQLLVSLEFKTFWGERVFSYHYRLRCTFMLEKECDKMYDLLRKLVERGDEEVVRYQEWVSMAELFEGKGIKLGFDRYFRLKGGRLYLYGKNWKKNKRNENSLDNKLVSLCLDDGKRWPSIECNGRDELETLLGLLGD